jgi:rfaE bifunctional protein nucleotidyltransferase chain/domain
MQYAPDTCCSVQNQCRVNLSVDMPKLLTLDQLLSVRRQAAETGKRVVFTNGCFDLLHPGHITYLRQARSLGDLLVVGINSDASVRRIKGSERPIMSETERAGVLEGLEMVDYITIFDEETPQELIAALLPDLLVKGGDWALDKIVGRVEVEAAGGSVHSLPYLQGASTSDIIARILSRYKNKS